MHLRPRNPKRDRLVNEPLAAYSYFQIGERPWGQGPGLFWILGGCSPSPCLPCSPCPFFVSGPVSGCVSVSLCLVSCIPIDLSWDPCLCVSLCPSLTICVLDLLSVCPCPSMSFSLSTVLCMSPSLSPHVTLPLSQVPSSHLLASRTTSRPWPRRAGSRCCVWGCGRTGRTTTYRICRTATARSG